MNHQTRFLKKAGLFYGNCLLVFIFRLSSYFAIEFFGFFTHHFLND
jgi:hypothetical protein